MTEAKGDAAKIWDNILKLSNEQDAIDKDVSAYNTRKLKPFYQARRAQLLAIPSFWSYAVRGAAELLDAYITVEDINLMAQLRDLYVEWDDAAPENFTVEVVFAPNAYLDDSSLTLRKSFTYRTKKTTATSSKEDDEEDEEKGEEEPWFLDFLELADAHAKKKAGEAHVSEPVAIKWKKNKNLTKLSGTGINSFFGWFNYIGEGPGDFPDGASLTRILVEQIFPFATEFYIEGVKDQAQVEAEYDLEEDEEDEEDIGDDDADDVKNRKKDNDDDGPSKKKVKTK